MLILYTKTGCPFCVRVLEKLNELDVSFDERNIADEKNLQELLSRGGKRQVPFLMDENPPLHKATEGQGRGITMYESGDIIGYLESTYGKT